MPHLLVLGLPTGGRAWPATSQWHVAGRLVGLGGRVVGVGAHVALTTDLYPPFRLDQGPAEPDAARR